MNSSPWILSKTLLVLAGLLGSATAAFADFTFVHPGLLQNREDLARIEAAVAAKTPPTFAGYEVFRADPRSRADYRMKGPFATVGRNPTVGAGDYDSDATAAYQNALMWTITGDIAHANKAKEIVNAWSATLNSITGRDAVLMAGLGPFKMVNAAEILRSTDAGWLAADIVRTVKHFREVIYPVIQDFAPFANGNWDTAAMKTMLAIGVFCDDRAIYERALDYYVGGAGDGRLSHYVIDEAGQCQESGRDQQHTQLGLAHLGDFCEIAWHQGLDLYGYDDNRLLKGFEYTAKYNLGEAVPFAETLDRTGKYRHTAISDKDRGRLRAVFEQINNHYANRAGLAAPSVKRAVEKIRPEGPGNPGADHVGYGTMLFTNDTARKWTGAPAAPGGVLATGSPEKITLAWIAPRGAKTCTIQRDGEILARDVAGSTFADTKVQPGRVYRYEIFAGESPASWPVTIGAGLPSPWTQQDIGGATPAGGANFDGAAFTLEAAGADIGGKRDQFHLVSVPAEGDATVVARYVPQLSSQLTRFGLMMRAGAAADAAQVSLLVDADTKANLETPGWKVRLVSRAAAGAETGDPVGSQNLAEPALSNGRLTGDFWLKLARAGDTFTGAYSRDGKTWLPLGTVTVALPRQTLAGLAACSRISNSTTVKFDHVAVTPSADARVANGIVSPDGEVVVNFTLREGGVPAYAIDYLGKPIVLESALGLLPGCADGFVIAKVTRGEKRGEWTQVYGERKVVPDNYRELNVDLKKPGGETMRLTFRAYDEGAAFRYSFPSQGGARKFSGEQSQFRFPAETFGWHEVATEGEYRRLKIPEFTPWCERPLTLEYASGVVASLTDAANADYPRMLLSPLSAGSDTLVTALGGTTLNTARVLGPGDPSFTLRPGQATPWRAFVVGEKPGDLLERNYLVLNLNAPSALKDVAWIRPAKIMRDAALSTANSKAVIDFAATAGLKYVLWDSGWYGPENGEASDPTRVAKRGLDVAEVIRYGKEKGVGLFLYVNRRHVEKMRDVIFPLYEKWGVAGVKLGFVDVGSRAATAWVTESIEKAAASHLMVNVHDGYRPTGLARTWPNLLTVEGIRGNEHFPTAEHDCTLPFTRYVAGSGDYTICYYNARLKTTHAHQLAMNVISYSPLQSVFWYDRPTAYGGEPEIEFFRHVPTVWDDTKVINGEIGKFATVARRSGDEWFVGTINGAEPRALEVPLAFLDPARRYIAHIYADDPAATTRTKVGVTTQPVDARTVLDASLPASGGQAIWITPAS